jgi:hypothetical protein
MADGELPTAARTTLKTGFVRIVLTCRSTFNIRSLPQRSHVIRMNHEGKALNGSSKASAPVGREPFPWLRK